MQTIKTNFTRTVNTVRALTEAFNRVNGKDTMPSEGKKVFKNGKHVLEFCGEYYANNGDLVEFLLNEFNNVWIDLGMVDVEFLTKQLHRGTSPMFTITNEVSTSKEIEEDEELTESAKTWSDNYSAYKESLNIDTIAKTVILEDGLEGKLVNLATMQEHPHFIKNTVKDGDIVKYYFLDSSFILKSDNSYTAHKI